MNGPTRLLLPLLAFSILTACDSEEQVFEDSAAYDEEADGETDAFDSDSAETGDYEEAPWAEDGDLASDPGAVGRLFPVNWGLGMNYAGGANGQHWANIFWDVNGGLPRDYTVCWRNVNEGGSVCGGVQVTHTATTGNTTAGGTTGRVVPLACEETYRVRVRRGLLHDTDTFTFDCPCADPCPDGGWFDGANCQMGQAPAGTTAFVWGNGYYHTALPGNVCPLPGSYYDGANCRVSTVPAGVDPFINNNHWYYVRACLP